MCVCVCVCVCVCTFEKQWILYLKDACSSHPVAVWIRDAALVEQAPDSRHKQYKKSLLGITLVSHTRWYIIL